MKNGKKIFNFFISFSFTYKRVYIIKVNFVSNLFSADPANDWLKYFKPPYYKK